MVSAKSIIVPSMRLLDEVADWFEQQFPCRPSYADEAELQVHIKSELDTWLRQSRPDWGIREGRRNFVSMFGWTLHTDLELFDEREVVPVEVKLAKEGSEYSTLHAMGQAIYYAAKKPPALALVVDQGRATQNRTEQERNLQNRLWWMLQVKLVVRKC